MESYQYDTGDRVIARIDALTKAAGYQYDGAGRLAQFTDRKGQLTTYQYDPADRVTRINYPNATHTRTYDTVGRLAEIREAASSMTYTYDNADRLVGVVTDSVAGRHEIAYDYDTLDRVTRRTVNGTDITTYAYDNASRLTAISYRNQTTSYEWDSASRLTAKVLPNGIRQEHAYDDADRLLAITYKKSDNSIIEAITYTYDAKGQRLTKSTGSASVRETAFSAVYDAANRLTSLTLTATGQSFLLTYDDNGNLVQKAEQGGAGAVTTYTWDTRNRLTQIIAPGVSASFQYDALNRRIARTVNGQTSGYVYDGMQAIGEVTGGTINANLLTGLAIDEVIARYSQSGNRTYLTDALGSVLALAMDDQSMQNFYAYSPYGEVSILGPDEGNPIQYTGRENDGTGLYYYRARYYDPVLKRFISEDPIGITGGANFYGYVAGNPITYTDPNGQIVFVPIIAAAGAAIGGLAGAISALNTPGATSSSVLIAALTGAAAGATAGIGGISVVASGIITAGANALGQVANNLINCQSISLGQVGVQGVIGAFAGGYGRLGANGLAPALQLLRQGYSAQQAVTASNGVLGFIPSIYLNLGVATGLGGFFPSGN